MATPSDAQLLERIARIEHSLAILTDELHQVRASIDSPPAFAPRTAPAESPRPTAAIPDPGSRIPSSGSRIPLPTAAPRRATWSAEEVEEVAGRYGMLALATVTGLAAVGTFLGWAISQGLLGPTVRVALGLLLAVALAGTGAWLRPRERSFGAALLGIALAVVHVCGWAVGPANLNLVPALVALTVTVAASAALAIFAHREDDEPLWCVGFGGAAIAPFVTSGESGSVAMLAAYGVAVLLRGSWALRRREWPIAGRVLTASAALFVGALLAAPHDSGSPLMALALATAVASAGVLPFAAPAMRRGRLRMLGALAAIAGFSAADSGSLGMSSAVVVGAIAAAGIAWVAMLDQSADLPTGSLLDGLLGEGGEIWDWIDAALIPLVFLGAVLVEVHDASLLLVTACAGTAAILAAFVARRAPGSLRSAAALALCLATLGAVWAATDTVGIYRPAIIALVAMTFVAGCRWRPASSWIPVAGVTLVLCSTMSYGMLATRPAYEYAPFLTLASAIAAVVAIAWFGSERLMHPRPSGPNAAAIAAWTWAFFWVHQELVEAFSPTMSTLLIISCYAATSVVAVWAGRTRHIPALRHVGLVFALVAAASAARGAARLDEVWARVAGYLVTSAFLLALAWWYRRRSPPVPAPEVAGTI